MMDEQEEPQASLPDGRTPAISRSDAVRRALAAGFEGAEEGTAYLRKEFGIELSTSLFLAAKATERKKGWAKSGKPGRKPRQSGDAGDDQADVEDDVTD